VSSADEIGLLRAAKDVATAEVTPQHLTLAGPEAYERLQGFAQMNPPIRDAGHREGLWRGLEVFDVLGSDHAPHTREEKARPYPQSPSGMPGVQTLVPVMLTHVAAGRLSLERFVDLTSAGAQRVFGIAGKGRLAEGYDADLTVVDLKARRTLRHEDMASRSGWTPFDGFEAVGWPVMTVVRGRVVMRDDQVVGSATGAPVRFTETCPRSPDLARRSVRRAGGQRGVGIDGRADHRRRGRGRAGGAGRTSGGGAARSAPELARVRRSASGQFAGAVGRSTAARADRTVSRRAASAAADRDRLAGAAAFPGLGARWRSPGRSRERRFGRLQGCGRRGRPGRRRPAGDGRCGDGGGWRALWVVGRESQPCRRRQPGEDHAPPRSANRFESRWNRAPASPPG
jgi:hypothetical protein